MYSMPNSEQALEQGQEGEAGAEDSGDWESSDEQEEAESKESNDEEEVDSPPRSEHRSKQQHDPAGGCRKSVAPSTHAQKRTQTSTPEPTEKTAKQPKVAPQDSEDFAADQDGRPSGFGVSNTLVLIHID